MTILSYTKTDVTVSKLQDELLVESLPVESVSFTMPDQLAVEYSRELTEPELVIAADTIDLHTGYVELREFIRQINYYRDDYMHGGLIFGGYSFNSEADSITNITGTATGISTMMLLGAPLPATLPWTVANNNEANMTPTEFQEFALKTMSWVSTVYTSCRYIKDSIITQYKSGDKTGAMATDYRLDPRWPSRDLGGSIAAPLTVKPFNEA